MKTQKEIKNKVFTLISEGKNNIKKVSFLNCFTFFDEVEALVRKYTNVSVGYIILEDALKKVLKNNKEINNFKIKLLNKMSVTND